MSTVLPSPLVDTDWLAEQLRSPNLRIIDCAIDIQFDDDGRYVLTPDRTLWEQSHIPGSIFVDVISQLSDPDHEINLMMLPAEKFVARMMELGVGDNTKVVLYDRGNHAWAARVWWMLRVCGFDNAAVLNGGYLKWQTQGHEVSDEQTAYPKAKQLTLNYRPKLMVTKADVIGSLGTGGASLMNCLSAEAFAGEVSAYPRSGRIPGSENLYCESLIDPESGCYFDSEILHAKFAKTSALDAGSVITYCGGGVGACSNALALTLLGVDNVAVYDGSLSEWTSDPDLPMETNG